MRGRTMNKAIGILFSITLLLGGCALGPDYEKPSLAVPEEYKANSLWQDAAPKDHLPKGKWWELFGDPVLNDLEVQAAGANQELKAALARLDQARAIARVSEADYVPRLDLNGSVSRGRSGPDFSSSGQGVTTTTYKMPLDLGYEIDLWGRVRRSVEAATADVQASAADLQTVALTLHAEVARNYFSLRALDKEIDLLAKTVDLRRENLSLVQSLFTNGRISPLDVERAETELASAQAEQVGLAKQRNELENALAVLLGKAVSEFSLTPTLMRNRPIAVASGLPSALLERRPDVAAAERQMAAANARIGVAKTAFFPAISLTGSLGYASTESSNLFKWDSRTWGLGPAISLPIFSSGRNSANLKRAEAAFEEAAANYRQQVLIAFRDVEDALAGIRFLDEQQSHQGRAWMWNGPRPN